MTFPGRRVSGRSWKAGSSIPLSRSRAANPGGRSIQRRTSAGRGRRWTAGISSAIRAISNRVASNASLLHRSFGRRAAALKPSLMVPSTLLELRNPVPCGAPVKRRHHRWQTGLGGTAGLDFARNLGCYVKESPSWFPRRLERFGTMGRNIFRDTGFRNWDLSVFKSFQVQGAAHGPVPSRILQRSEPS